MNREKLQILISAGVFSAVLLSGAAYAADKPAGDDSSVQASTDTPKTDQAPAKDAKAKKSDKDAAQSGCSSANGCGSH